MSILKFLLYFVIFSASLSQSFATNLSSCTITQPCNPGLVCIGANGNNPGVCANNGISIVLCRINTYFTSKLGKPFMMFALVMLGVAFFLGKVSWGMIISICIGCGLIYGSTSIAQYVSGTNSDYCVSSDVAMQCASVLDTISIIPNSAIVYNLSGQTAPTGYYISGQIAPTCNTALSCVQYNCQNVSIDLRGTCTVLGGSKVVYGPSSGLNACSTPCIQVQSLPMDYFLCNNNCNKGTTAPPFAKMESPGRFQSCQDSSRQAASLKD